ncbi:hypothetical protein lerEdw1_005040 [Lerista edwardsae]|nr:hypothetical protein lerEdw1_005040 [Lerista edwardsae]
MLGGARLLCQRPLGRTVPAALRAWLSTCGPDSVACSKEAKHKGGLEDFHARLAAGPSLQHFLQEAAPVQASLHLPAEAAEDDPAPYLNPGTLAEAPSKGLYCCFALADRLAVMHNLELKALLELDRGTGDLSLIRRMYLETYGCQMNVSDTEIAWSILQRSGYLRTRRLEEVRKLEGAVAGGCQVVREKAEQTIWNRLRHITALKSKRRPSQEPLRIGILGCMAERLKAKILDQERLVDVVAGPDAYRDLPRLLAVASSGQQAANVLLSLDETYADVLPVHTSGSGTSAFVSIMRGCDNMCSYCIVPFTRGRERSRPVASILQEVQMLSDQGVKEVTLLGQNVNSYRDTSELRFLSAATTQLSRGFSTAYRAKQGGLRFAGLLDRVSAVNPEMRIRFTSPHPKDFPDEAGVFQLMRDRRNLCRQLHLPVQSGSTRVLEAMRRGYTREAYLELVHHARDFLPGVALSSDFIAGFCGETEADHQQTVSLLREVGYSAAFIFAYSMRQKTRAFHRLQDDVPPEVKRRRLQELTSVFREEAARANAAVVGRLQVVLVEGPSKRSPSEKCGRNDGNVRVIFPDVDLDDGAGSAARAQPGDYVLVKISSASSQTLKGTPVCKTTLRESAAFC